MKFNEFPVNCGAGIINLDSNDGDSSNSISNFANYTEPLKLAIYCASCEPGYSPNYLAPNVDKVITSCTKIDNCDLNLG